jgi:hypothetical protein
MVWMTILFLPIKDGVEVGRFEIHGNNLKDCGFIYVEKDVNITGSTFDSYDNIKTVYRYSLKKGWNRMFFVWEDEHTLLATNEQPGGLKWYFVEEGDDPQIEEPIDSGTTWTLTGEDDNLTLTISGKGAMENYSYYGDAPWYSNRENIKTLVINNGITSIGNSAFGYCSGLTSVDILNSVTSIGNSAFQGCSKLTSVDIPNSVMSIGKIAFYDCSGLTSFAVAANNPSYSSVDGVLFDKSRNTLVQYPEGRAASSYVIPNSVRSIGEYAFSWCRGLTSVDIPNSVTSISNYAFSYCSGLTSVSIPNSVTSIGGYAFYGCGGLTDVTVHWATPLAINSSVFENLTIANVNLHVPAGTTGLYQAADVWKGFKYN